MLLVFAGLVRKLAEALGPMSIGTGRMEAAGMVANDAEEEKTPVGIHMVREVVEDMKEIAEVPVAAAIAAVAVAVVVDVAVAVVAAPVVEGIVKLLRHSESFAQKRRFPLLGNLGFR